MARKLKIMENGRRGNWKTLHGNRGGAERHELQRCNGYVARHEKAKARADALQEQKKQRQAKADAISGLCLSCPSATMPLPNLMIGSGWRWWRGPQPATMDGWYSDFRMAAK